VSAGTGGEGEPAAAILREFGHAVILYDGECPVCGEYLSLLKIRELAGEVELVNARSRPDLVEDLRTAGYEINDGIVLAHQGGISYGASALSLIAQLDESGRRLNRASAAVFRLPVIGEALYVVLKAGRKLLLRLLGRDLI
jgi:predicted DCC family thiol-disulfide oxidoreductase YuxK